MYTTTAGDVGEEKKRVIMEPVEVPVTVPAEEPVPA
jgi:hypothetical protein